MVRFKTVPAYSWLFIYLFIFANTKIQAKQYKTHLKIVKTIFDKFFQCMAEKTIDIIIGFQNKSKEKPRIRLKQN